MLDPVRRKDRTQWYLPEPMSGYKDEDQCHNRPPLGRHKSSLFIVLRDQPHLLTSAFPPASLFDQALTVLVVLFTLSLFLFGVSPLPLGC